ncbi:MAG: AAA family ATPase, partial [Spirochaetia bacterium]|nr:AAA family ATPase [Spirochaetia bacterium]
STFMQIKSGSLIKASGGFVIINADDLFQDEYSWDYLKRTLKSGEIQIQPQTSPFSTMGTSIKPQPIKIDVKVILIGDIRIYYKLSETDGDFGKYFNVTAIFDNQMDFTDENIRQFVCLVAEFGKKMHYKPITDEGIGYLLKFGRKLTEDRRKLSVRFSKINDLLTEANYWAKEMGLREITVETLKKAEEEKKYFLSIVEDEVFDSLKDGTTKIQVDGKRTGAINGLVVCRAPYEFGQPTLLTAACTAGDDGIINIEHEAGLSCESYDKAVMIIEGFLRSHYEDKYHMSFRASICFEQSFALIDGDSASAAEIFAILSAVSGVPLRQDLAVTGSVNQHGDIQPIGGVSEKIAGFYKLCKLWGLTGKQGVVVPKSNIDNILLSQEIIDAVAQKKFHIYPISTVDEGIELFTGMESKVFNALAKKKFKELSSKVKGNK